MSSLSSLAGGTINNTNKQSSCHDEDDDENDDGGGKYDVYVDKNDQKTYECKLKNFSVTNT